LRAFKAAGGKLIMWQGLADQLIFTGDSILLNGQHGPLR
jgi:hypothetical protein